MIEQYAPHSSDETSEIADADRLSAMRRFGFWQANGLRSQRFIDEEQAWNKHWEIQLKKRSNGSVRTTAN